MGTWHRNVMREEDTSVLRGSCADRMVCVGGGGVRMLVQPAAGAENLGHAIARVIT